MAERQHRIKARYSWRQAIAESDLPSSARAVAWRLEHYMSDTMDGAFPSIKRLSRETGLSERTVQGAIRILRAGGWLDVKFGGTVRGTDGKAVRLANEYRATFPTSIASEIAASLTPGATVAGGPVQPLRDPGATAAGAVVHEIKNHARTREETPELDLARVNAWLGVQGADYAADLSAFGNELRQRFGIGLDSELGQRLRAEALRLAEARDEG